MKKFTRIIICLLLCVFSFAFVACDKRTEEEKNFTYPSWNDTVYGNGGLAVRKGNYLYFVNGYQDLSKQGDKNATYNVGSLMLTKLDENGQVVRDENGLLRDDYYITMNNKLCGYKATNLYIFGDYLYFVSPCLEDEVKEHSSDPDVWAKERVIFNRIKLDKTGDVEEVYRSGAKYDKMEYEYYLEGGNLFILIWEKEAYYEDNGANALIRVHANAKSNSKIANDVTDVVFDANYDQIFYLVKDKEIKQYNIATGGVIDYSTESSKVDLACVADGKIYYTKAHEYVSSTELKASTIASQSGFELVYSYTGTLELDATSDGGYVTAVSGNKIYIIVEKGNTKTILDADATSIKIMGYANGAVIYHDGSKIKMVSYSNVVAGSDPQILTLSETATTINNDLYDLSADENYMYFLKQEGSNFYLNRIKVVNNINLTEEMVGVYNADDIPEVEEEEEVEE